MKHAGLEKESDIFPTVFLLTSNPRFPKIGESQIIHFHRIFHDHPFWGTPNSLVSPSSQVGANKNQAMRNGLTPLMAACLQGHEEAHQSLREKRLLRSFPDLAVLCVPAFFKTNPQSIKIIYIYNYIYICINTQTQ